MVEQNPGKLTGGSIAFIVLVGSLIPTLAFGVAGGIGRLIAGAEANSLKALLEAPAFFASCVTGWIALIKTVKFERMKADEYEVDAHHERSYQDKMQRTKKGMVGGFVGTAIALAAAAFIAIAVPGATGPLRDQGGGQQPQTKPRQKVQEQPNVPERRTAAEQNMQRQQRQPEVTGPNQQNAAILDQRLTDGRTVWKALDSLGVDVLELKNRMIYADKNTLAKLVEDINAELRNAGLSIGSGNLPRKRIGALIPKDTLNLADGPRDVNWMARIAARNKQSRQGLRNLALQAHGIPRHQRALEARIA